MLRELNFSYTLFIGTTITTTLFTILSMSFWGKIGDKFGNRFLLSVGNLLVFITAISWIFSKNPFYLLIVPQFFSGIGWGAFNLASSNFIYDAVTPQKRPLCSAYLTFLRGIAVLFGAFFGGLFVEYIQFPGFNIFLIAIFISGIFRLLTGLFFLPKIKEVRNVDKLNLQEFSIITYPLAVISRPFNYAFAELRTFFVFLSSKAF
jgi:MFS family permease